MIGCESLCLASMSGAVLFPRAERERPRVFNTSVWPAQNGAWSFAGSVVSFARFAMNGFDGFLAADNSEYIPRSMFNSVALSTNQRCSNSLGVVVVSAASSYPTELN
jgi:hypothetical protein